MPLAQLTILAAALLGWSDTITIQPSRGDRSSGLQRSIAGLDRPSDRTLETLRRFDLDKEYRQKRQHGAAASRKIRPAPRRARAGLCPGRAFLDRRQASRSLAEAAGHRPLPGRRGLRPRLSLRDRARARRRPRTVRPALPPGLRDLQRRCRTLDPRCPDQRTDPASERRGHPVQGPRTRAVAANRPPTLAVEPGGHS